jgi:D-alanyl-D-alanine carboxypeptidase (penicillin-binding protein 5/6)
MVSKRLLPAFTAACTLLLSWVQPAAVHAQNAAAAYIVTDNTTGFVLNSLNSQKKRQIGSLTKIATAMVVLDWVAARGIDISQQATVPESAQALNAGNGVGFNVGDRCSVRDLLYAMMMQSDNQAAETLATHVGRALSDNPEPGPVPLFVSHMNALARKLGMKNTRFLNPHGLDNLERTVPYSTAEDLAKLCRYAMDRSGFLFYVSQKERRISLVTTTGEVSGYLLRNTNELLGQNSIDGVKTGTTLKAGPCLIVSAARPPESRQQGETHIITPKRLNVVVLGSADRFQLAAQLLSEGWRSYDAWAAAGRPLRGWKSSR